jgi:hypothetical protein
MSVLEIKPPDQQRLIECLAEQCHEPVDKVTLLYEQERLELAKTARITQFLHVFVTRNVREILRKQRLPCGSARAEPDAVIRV